MQHLSTTDFLNQSIKFGMRQSLDELNYFMDLLKQPQNDYPTVHIAGTNGKGSIAILTTHILCSANYLVGTFTSPHIIHYNEAILINGLPISDTLFEQAGQYVQTTYYAHGVDQTGPLTTFELLTAIMFVAFSIAKVNIAIIETGLGGTLDSTNVIAKPLVVVFSSISKDHLDILGTTIESITLAKSGIIKHGCHVLVAPNLSEVETILHHKAELHFASYHSTNNVQCRWQDTQLHITSKGVSYAFHPKLQGAHQSQNIGTVIKLIELLTAYHPFKVSQQCIVSGVNSAYLPCRQEWITIDDFHYLLDGAHNFESIQALLQTLKNHACNGKIYLLFGILKDKEIIRITTLLKTLPLEIVLTEPLSPRKCPLNDLMALFEDQTVIYAHSDYLNAFHWIQKKAAPNDLIVIAGSFYLSYPCRDHLMGELLT